MPWSYEGEEGYVISCEKPGVGARASCDPWIAEWGNPTEVIPVIPVPE